MTGSAIDPLLAALAGGDEEAFEKVHKRFAAKMFWAALRMLDHRQDAEDVVQQVFADFIRASARWTEVNDLSAYLFSSLRRAAYKTATRRRRSLSPILSWQQMPLWRRQGASLRCRITNDLGNASPGCR